jgi:hypothetical protein
MGSCSGLDHHFRRLKAVSLSLSNSQASSGHFHIERFEHGRAGNALKLYSFADHVVRCGPPGPVGS